MSDVLGPRAPRVPVRANGRLRYELLLDAAERLLQRGDLPALTIKALAQEAGVPMASVYHFLPHPDAVAIALSQRYLTGLEAALCAPMADVAALGWPGIVATLNRRAVHYYRQHPYAQVLILGSDHSWAIRQADLANNRRIAETIVALLAEFFPAATPDALMATVVSGITMGDALFSLSIAEHGAITDALARDAWLAVCSFLAAQYGKPLPSVDFYSIFIEQG
jgi:AcrR family transcriptional regulator